MSRDSDVPLGDEAAGRSVVQRIGEPAKRSFRGNSNKKGAEPKKKNEWVHNL